MQSRAAKIGFAFVAITSVAVALWSERFFAVFNGLWPFIDPGIRGVVTAFPVRALTHMLIAPLALLLGPFQFIKAIRAKAPRVHRYMGRIYVACCVIAGVAGFATAFHASGGPVAGWGFGILAVLWVGSSLGGMWAAMQRKFALHRLLMSLSYAMTFGAVTLRLQIPVGFMLGYPGYPAMSVWLAYTSWIPNVLAVLAYFALTARARRRSVAQSPVY
ncbi:MAG: hypothetical protein QOI59_6361 [Gammaproteobacteria bacterium]|nr:hypothetical protein [Gammaproteobacteria bacterium]